jgi:hypothetical protein
MERKLRPPLPGLLLLATLALLPACGSPAAVGGPCEIRAGGDDRQSTTLTSPALECEGRTCIKHDQGPSLCSASCSTDDDCSNVHPAGAALCRTGFTCVAPVAVGDFACHRFCVCRDNLTPPRSCASAR